MVSSERKYEDDVDNCVLLVVSSPGECERACGGSFSTSCQKRESSRDTCTQSVALCKAEAVLHQARGGEEWCPVSENTKMTLMIAYSWSFLLPGRFLLNTMVVE